MDRFRPVERYVLPLAGAQVLEGQSVVLPAFLNAWRLMSSDLEEPAQVADHHALRGVFHGGDHGMEDAAKITESSQMKVKKTLLKPKDYTLSAEGKYAFLELVLSC